MSDTQKHTKPNVPNLSVKREQKELQIHSAERETNVGRNVPNLRFPGFEGEWVLIKLRDIAEIKTGPFGSTLHAKDYVSDGTPIITTEHFKTGSLPIEKSGLPQVSPTDYLRLKSYRLSINDIVFSRVGSVDINAHVNKEQEGWLFSGRVLRVRPNSSINSHYLHWCLSTEKNRANIARRAVGQTMPSINTEILNETELFISDSHKEQDKIASLLTLVDERISIQNKVIEDFKMLKATLSRKLLWDNPLLSKRVQLSNFGTLKNGYAFKSSEYIPESEFRIVTIANVTGEREISINNCNTIHSLPRDIQEHQKLKPNDILGRIAK